MAENKMRWKWGETNPITEPTASSTVINAGDLLWRNSTSGKVEPASTFAKDTDLATTQAAFAAAFVGVAMQASPAGTAGYIRVATTGVFEFTDSTTSPSHSCGAYVGANLNAATTYLEDTKVISVAKSYLAIGRIAHVESVPSGKAFVEICSTTMRGGVAASDPEHETASSGSDAEGT